MRFPPPPDRARLNQRFQETGEFPVVFSDRCGEYITVLPDHAPEPPGRQYQGQWVVPFRVGELPELKRLPSSELRQLIRTRLQALQAGQAACPPPVLTPPPPAAPPAPPEVPADPKALLSGSALTYAVLELFQGRIYDPDEAPAAPPPAPRRAGKPSGGRR
jgi:hypothetical protein